LTHTVVYTANKTLQYELRPRDHNTKLPANRHTMTFVILMLFRKAY